MAENEEDQSGWSLFGEILGAVARIGLLVGSLVIVLAPMGMSFHDRVLGLLWFVILAILLSEK